MKKIFFTLTIVSGLTFYSPTWADTSCFEIHGMTCSTCPLTVKAAIKRLKGITAVEVSLKEENAWVNFDSLKTSVAEIKKAVDDAGHKATPRKCNET